MKRYSIVWLFLSIFSCSAMDDADYEYAIQGERSSYSSEEVFKQKKQKVAGMPRYYAMSLDQAGFVLSNITRRELLYILMRQFVRRDFGFTTQHGIIEAVYHEQHGAIAQGALVKKEVDSNSATMECPACDSRIQSIQGKQRLFRNMYKHWFEHKIHQPFVYEQMARLVGRSEEQARANFAQYGLPVARIVPFGQQDPLPLTLDSDPVHTLALRLMESDSLLKVLAVQEGIWPKALTCPVPSCEFLVYQDINNNTVTTVDADLFTAVALHCLQNHHDLEIVYN